MTKRSEQEKTLQNAAGARSGRPIMVLLDQLGRKWTLRILWELRQGRMTFRQLQSSCEDVSPTILNRRLKELRELKLIDHGDEGYGFTGAGAELGDQLLALATWSEKWGQSL